jgi:hypothetical protein
MGMIHLQSLVVAKLSTSWSLVEEGGVPGTLALHMSPVVEGLVVYLVGLFHIYQPDLTRL